MVRVGELARTPYGGDSMLGFSSRWIIHDNTPPSNGVQGGLRDRLLKIRANDSYSYSLETSLTQLDDPAVLPGAEEAGESLAKAIADGRSIAIYGDYDVDGISASTLLRSMLRAIAPDTEIPIRIPNRLEEGYGLNSLGLRELRKAGADLVITVDCGISSISEVAEARDDGLDMIVTDHHEPLQKANGDLILPEAAVIAHPRLPGASGYPELAGAGVAFKVAWAAARAHCGSERLPTVLRDALIEALPFAAMGTIADVVPLTGENRILAAQGLRRMAGAGNIGLRALLKECGASGSIDEELIKFQIAPRINALGRLGSAQPALDLFAETDPAAARILAKQLTEVNIQRRAAQDELVAQAIERALSEGQDQPDHPFIVLADTRWQQGLCGSAAAKVLERFNRPVILLEICEDGMARGSARSIMGYSVRDALLSCESLLDRFGGHDAAAGISLLENNVDDLRAGLVLHAQNMLDDAALQPTLDVDCRASLWEMGCIDEIHRMRELAPFGHGNPEPKVLVEGVKAVQHRWIGAENSHLKLVVIPGDAKPGAAAVDAIWFRADQHRAKIDEALRHGTLDLVVEPGLNTFNGRTHAQMKVADARVGV